MCLCGCECWGMAFKNLEKVLYECMRVWCLDIAVMRRAASSECMFRFGRVCKTDRLTERLTAVNGFKTTCRGSGNQLAIEGVCIGRGRGLPNRLKVTPRRSLCLLKVASE